MEERREIRHWQDLADPTEWTFEDEHGHELFRRGEGESPQEREEAGYLERIDVPLALLTAGKDEVVDIASHAPIVGRIRGARHAVIDGAKHEIMMETDAVRARFWAEFDGFVAPLFP